MTMGGAGMTMGGAGMTMGVGGMTIEAARFGHACPHFHEGKRKQASRFLSYD